MGNKLWSDCHGGVITTELLLVSTIVVATLLAGLSTFRKSVVNEFQDLGQSVESVDDFSEESLQQEQLTQPSRDLENQMLLPEVYFPNDFVDDQR